MLFFDGIHTLTFVFASSRLVGFYVGAALRLQRAVIVLEDSGGINLDRRDGVYADAHLRRSYSVKVVGASDIGIVAIVNAFSQLAAVPVLNAERPRVADTAVVDNRYLLIRFQQETCPLALRGVTHIALGDLMVIHHHHLVHLRQPCSRCYSPETHYWVLQGPTGAPGPGSLSRFRVFTGQVSPFMVGGAAQYQRTEENSLDTFLATLAQEQESQAADPKSSRATLEPPPTSIGVQPEWPLPNKLGGRQSPHPEASGSKPSPEATHDTPATGQAGEDSW
ncbi:hypothetical protein ON010_g19000 [Phytophthora cinnamomi]|nr:hypothetical protein ON010_g19000 [Phytophthora cinnamomi]